ncbi:uncharacterized protein LOC111113176 [Crassostrea virginica]
MGKKCKSKESIKARSRRRRSLKKNHHNSKSQRITDTTNEIQTDDSLSTESFDERDHCDINKDPFFKDFKKYVASKVLLEKAKEKVKDCCGPSVVKTVDGQVRIVFLDKEYNF